jgi:serine/threonine protein kinase
MESAICDLGEFESRYPINDELIWSITYQLFISLSILHLKYGIYHKDIKKQNVLVLRVKPGGYFRYIMNDKEYFVKNHGYLFCLHDFGLSIDFKSQEMKGARNAKVRDDGKLEPITCEYELQYNTETRRFFVDKETDPMKVKWVDGDKIITGTYNLTLNERVKPTIPVDTKDFVHFPMMEFFNDIQNLLGTIAGTRDAYVYRYNYKTELYDHLALEDISNKIIEKFRKVQPLDSSFPYDTSSAIYLRADMMLDYLYEEPDNIDNIEVCDLFVCNF